ncbi:MAG: LTA synthase family protein [Bacteroidota bacterium]
MLSNNYQYYKGLLSKFFLLMLIFSFLRLLFYINYPQTGGAKILLDFLYGLRFDASAIGLLLLPYFIINGIAHLHSTKKWWLRITDGYLLLVVFFSALLNLIDTAWFEYTGKRTTSDVFSLLALGNDINNNISSYLLHYWYLLLILIIILFGCAIILKKINQHFFLTSSHHQLPLWKMVFIYLTLMGLVFIGIRGGTQLRPISIQNAITGVNPNEVPLILNTPFTILKSWRDDPIPSIKYVDDIRARKTFDYEKVFTDAQPMNRLNVVVLIMESFSKHLIGSLTNRESYTPFLDSLAKESWTCTNAFANGKRSIEGIPAIISSIPHLTDEPFITGAYNVNRINSFASILNKQGYESAFFHGGHNGTMGFDNFSKVAGYKNYYGSNEYVGKAEDDDGRWGIYDDSFLGFMLHKMDEMKPPFHTAFFSLSSHDPYVIPSKFKNKFPEGKEKYQASIQYADFALSQFFKSAATKPWFSNTLFIIVADHTGPSNGDYYTNAAGQLAIPILYYCPALQLKGQYNGVTQQTDILPTTLSLLNFSGQFSAFGNSIVKSNASFNMSYSNGIWQLIHGTTLLQFDGEKTTGIYNLSNDSLLKNNLIRSYSKFTKDELLLKSYLQEFRTAMLTNTICKP